MRISQKNFRHNEIKQIEIMINYTTRFFLAGCVATEWNLIMAFQMCRLSSFTFQFADNAREREFLNEALEYYTEKLITHYLASIRDHHRYKVFKKKKISTSSK